jgi:hypothetical protein
MDHFRLPTALGSSRLAWWLIITCSACLMSEQTNAQPAQNTARNYRDEHEPIMLA